MGLNRTTLIAIALLLGCCCVTATGAGVNPPRRNIPKERPIIAPATSAILMDVTPYRGVSGDKVVIRGKGIPTDKSQNEVWFVLNPGVEAPAMILSVTSDQDIISYRVQVPTKPGLKDGWNGSVYMKPSGGTPTNSQDFQFYPHPPPTITQTAPVIGRRGMQVTLFGINFKPDDEIHCQAGGEPVPDQVLVKQYVSPMRVNVTLPMFVNAHKKVELYIIGKFSTGPMRGPSYYLLTQSPSRKPSGDGGETRPG